MARTPHDAVAALLRRTPLPNQVRGDAWDAFHGSATTDELASKLRTLPLPKVVRASLWDLKNKHAARKESQMLPRESKFGRYDQVMPSREVMPSDSSRKLESAVAGAQHPAKNTASVSRFIADHFRHFNAATLHDAAEAYKAHLAKGGQMLVSIAGAMSTAELGRCLAPMIRAQKIHAISCTGANLEEDLFNLIAHDEYERMPDYHELTIVDDAKLAKRNINRVTDTGIPEKAAMTPIEKAFHDVLETADGRNERVFPHEILYDIVRHQTLVSQYQGDPALSWLVAAAEVDLPIVVPGWEDSTLGNVFAADVLDDTFDAQLIRGGIEYMVDLAKWYQEASKDHPMGFCQIGGGIAGDFAICVVPLLEQDAGHKDTKLWQYFLQLTDADETMGGYSGALPNEKASWKKIGPDTPAFNVKGDASINFPLLAAIVMGW